MSLNPLKGLCNAVLISILFLSEGSYFFKPHHNSSHDRCLAYRRENHDYGGSKCILEITGDPL
jgi:hypothetical protein